MVFKILYSASYAEHKKKDTKHQIKHFTDICSLKCTGKLYRWLKKEEEAQVTTKEFNTGPKLDLGFKEGQTITINVAKVW